MAIVTGRLASFRFGATGIDYIGKWTLNISADTVEASYFGSYWSAAQPVGQKWSGTVEGYFDATTTLLTQTTMWNAVFSAQKLQDVRFYVGGSTTGLFYMPQFTTVGVAALQATDAGCYLSNWKHSVGAKEVGTITFDVLGYKGIGLFASSSQLIQESTG